MTPGFIGTGTITSALVRGLCTTAHPPDSVWISPRNPQKAAGLQKAFDAVRIGRDNQEVVDRSDLVILAVRPQDARDVLTPLRFRADQHVVSLLAGTSLSEVRPFATPAARVVRAVPLPSVERHLGPIALYPGDEPVEALFADLGTVIAAGEEAELDKLLVITALMAPYYALLEAIVSWAAGAGVEPKTAADYTAAMFRALSVMVEAREDGDLPAMVRESMTPGGLNEQALTIIERRGGFAPVTAALEGVEKRITE